MPTLGPQIVTGSYGNLLKFIDIGEDGVETGQIRISDGKGKPTPLFLATGSAYVSGTLSASAEVVFSGLTSNAPGQYVSFDTSDGRLYYSNTSSIVPTNALNATSASYAVTASYAISAAFAPNDGDWTIGSSYMTASGQTSVYIPNRLENGLRNFAQGNDSHAEGSHSLSSGQFSHAEGRATSASGYGSHAEGVETNSPGAAAHAEGKGTIAGVGLGDGDLAHAEGHFTKALSFSSHAEGDRTYASASHAHAEGAFTSASGIGSHAEGHTTLASNNYSHAEGKNTIASGYGSHAEGTGSIASNNYSHAEGKKTVASGINSHAEGSLTLATNNHAHAEGGGTIADGVGSHTEGLLTSTTGDYSHVGGVANTTHLAGQTVVGQYNKGNYPNGNDTFVVGTGTGLNTGDKADGLKVRVTIDSNSIPQGQVIVNQTTDTNRFNPIASGIYLGEPQDPFSSRIISRPNGTLEIQSHTNSNGDYETMLQSGVSAQFVPD